MLIPLVLGAGALYALYKYSTKSTLVDSIPVPTASGYAPAPANTSGIKYPQASTVMNPDDSYTKAQVIRYQNAQPMPTGKYYQPVDGDLASIVSLRFDSDTDDKGKLLPTKTNATALWYADLGKLNGFLGLSDLGAWLKAKKPLHLPAGSADKGSRPGAMGAITGG